MPSEALLHRLRQRRREDENLEARDRIGGEADLVESREVLGAVLLTSPDFGHVWLARDWSAAADLREEQTARGAAGEAVIPVVTFDEVPQLRGRHPELMRALLAVRAAFPGSRLQIQ